jgi:hypothetical protein
LQNRQMCISFPDISLSSYSPTCQI